MTVYGMFRLPLITYDMQWRITYFLSTDYAPTRPMEKTNAERMLPDRRFLVHSSDLALKAQVRKERQ
jgi:hypothetical protein